MVICTYFLNNSCRYGTKCNNEHVNVKLTLKTDAEGALNGKQWPLSSYGPFRDKPCIPNFIEDQSFEEIRHLCYEAKASGNVQMVTNQFTQNALDARNKMTMLTNPSDDIIRLAVNLYNSSCTNTPAQNTVANPFGMGSTMNTGTTASIFGGGNAASTGSTNLFGSSSQTANSNPFARSTVGFGATTQNQTTTNLFGGSTATSSNSMNLFGAQTNQNAAKSLFGGSSFSNTPNTSAFGGGVNQTTSLFGGSNTSSGPFSQSTNASPFALSSTTNQTTSLFGGQQQQQSNPIFGGGATFGSQVKTGLFGQAAASMGQSTTSGNIFGQSVQQTSSPFGASPAQTASIFGAATQNQTQSIFGGVQQQQQQSMQSQDNPFAAVAQSATTNIFGGGAQMQQQPQQASPFQSTTNAFGANTNMNMGQSLFGSANQMNTAPVQAQMPPQTLQQQQQSIFGTNNFAAAQPQQTPFGGNAFQNAQEAQKPQAPLFGGQTQQSSNIFGGMPAAATAAAPQIQESKTLYTPMEQLSPEEIDAFNNNTFDISKIPTKPPPMELCI